MLLGFQVCYEFHQRRTLNDLGKNLLIVDFFIIVGQQRDHGISQGSALFLEPINLQAQFVSLVFQLSDAACL